MKVKGWMTNSDNNNNNNNNKMILKGWMTKVRTRYSYIIRLEQILVKKSTTLGTDYIAKERRDPGPTSRLSVLGKSVPV